MTLSKSLASVLTATLILSTPALAYIPDHVHPEHAPIIGQDAARALADRSPVIDIHDTRVGATDAGGGALPGMVDKTTTIYSSVTNDQPMTGATLR